MYELLS